MIIYWATIFLLSSGTPSQHHPNMCRLPSSSDEADGTQHCNPCVWTCIGVTYNSLFFLFKWDNRSTSALLVPGTTLRLYIHTGILNLPS